MTSLTGRTASWAYKGARGVPEPRIWRPQCAQDDRFWVPGAPKGPLEWFKAFPRRLQEPLETPQDRPRWPKTRPRRLQVVILVSSTPAFGSLEFPRCQWPLGQFKEFPKRLQERFERRRMPGQDGPRRLAPRSNRRPIQFLVEIRSRLRF